MEKPLGYVPKPNNYKDTYYEALATEETEKQPEVEIEEEWQHLQRGRLSAAEKSLYKKIVEKNG